MSTFALRPRFVPLLSGVLLSLVSFPGALLWADGEKDKKEERPEKVIALGGLDPIALIGGEKTRGDEAISVESNGYVYHFASKEHRERFEKDPKRYGIQGDGSCPVVAGVQSEPDIFSVFEGRIYIFGSWGCVSRFEEDPEQFVSSPPKPRKVAILIWDGVELLDFTGPGEVFSAAGHRSSDFEVFTVAKTREPILSQGFLTVVPQYDLESCPPPDLLLVPGGGVRRILQDQAVIQWIREVSEEAELVASVCTGAFALAKAGLLDGRQATTFHGAIEDLKRAAPKAEVISNRRVVDTGKVVTAGGVACGIDLALHLVRRLSGEELAKQTAAYMEYRWIPSETAVSRAGK